MNKISTGHSFLDLLLCLFVPLILRSVVPWLTDWVSGLFSKEAKKEEVFTRNIEYTNRSNYWWYDSGDSGPPNSTLQRAIINYINKRVQVLGELPVADFQLKKKPPPEAKLVITGDEEDEAAANAAEHDFDVNHVPPVGTWVDLKNGIKFMRQQENLDDKQKNQKITYFLESSHKNGNAVIEEFVREALALYRDQQASKVDYSRYLYIPVLTGLALRATQGEGEGGKRPSAIYKRYKLSEEKTFASFFHPDKDAILGLVGQFMQKTGKFGIPGYPQKLGFLLYGPPGTGKTSFIKALGQYTKRSIISIPLTKIHTNQELMDIMFDQRISVENEEGGINLPYSKTIFVMEDVDAASTVVHRRTQAPDAATLAAIAASMSRAAEGPEQGPQNKPKKEGEGEIEADKDDEGGKKPSTTSVSVGGGALKGIGPSWGRSIFGDDALNLAGLLNVLDGVVDTPERIIVMTTNHPEALDPALIRPGRINKKIYMGRICVEEALHMMRHYFGAVAPGTEAALREVFIDEALSPAEMETMCADYDSAEDMVGQLAVKFGVGGGRLAPAAPTPYVRTF